MALVTVTPSVSRTRSIWDTLSAEEFEQLQAYTKYSKKRLKDVLKQFRDGEFLLYKPEEPMNYDGFKLFMNAYLGNDISDELCQHLFHTFCKEIPINNAAIPINNAAKSSIHQTETMISEAESGIHTGITSAAIVATIPITHRDTAAITHSSSHTHLTGSLCHELDRLPRSSSDGLNWPSRILPTRRSLISLNGLTKNSSVENTPSSSRNNSTKKKQSVTDQLLFNTKSAHETVAMVSIREIACYLSLLEGGEVKDKLEYGNEYLDQQELESIIQQMMSVARYLGWDVTELKPILQDMLLELDCDSDGRISLEEWIKGGLTTIPLLVLLGLDPKIRDDGQHQWRQKHFSKPAHCNMCHCALTGRGFRGRQGLQCIFCKFTVHERCVNRVPASCINTYVKTKRAAKLTMDHHWVEGNCFGKCSKCGKTIKNTHSLSGLHCTWCHIMIHNKCVSQTPLECDLGEHRIHILPPICIHPASMNKHRSGSDCEDHAVQSRSNTVLNLDGMPIQITPLPNTNPLVVFINPKSGGRQGTRLLWKFQYLLNPRQVFNLADGGPTPGLKFFASVPNFHILCCGGDGTAGWVLSCLDKLCLSQSPPVAILPLGTGNDLSRHLRWGGGYEGERLSKILKSVENSSIVSLDRWEITVEHTDECDVADQIPLNIINNYCSIGVDASITLSFHLKREAHPEKFKSRLMNKFKYFEYGTSENFSATCKNLHENLELICDGKKLDLAAGPSLEGIAILNIPSYAGGTHPWGEVDKKKSRKKNKKAKFNGKDDNEWAEQDIGDGLIEVVGFENALYVGQIIAGVRAHALRLAQCSTITIITKKLFPIQIDGEPWKQAPATIRISHFNQVPMLQGPLPSKKGFFSRRKAEVEQDLDTEL
ncbi:diacylglycerol kinase 1-like isoform X2 [Xenia sp. Carnegie-2017]|uniref:diacylglycerol kinase 1-like isoform X2 n=1 Tax=Xenia sp. Carnegie-2017 TaxID=2897299 RepID=UPI001F0431BC|nr:diacylglycerol kinase 1-like isoform X2 [Xenia sp. Carnegie-2017]